jgi:DNA invertase Pin-like site-specific DNA recombinase
MARFPPDRFASQTARGLLRAKYDDGGFSGGNTDRPALQRLLDDVRAGKVDVIVVYKIDRLTRSLADRNLLDLPHRRRLAGSRRFVNRLSVTEH